MMDAQQPRLFVGMILILIFAEALGLYGHRRFSCGFHGREQGQGLVRRLFEEVRGASIMICRGAVRKTSSETIVKLRSSEEGLSDLLSIRVFVVLVECSRVGQQSVRV